MPELYVKCKNCGWEFPTGIGMDRESFRTAVDVTNYHLCPRCKQTHLYRKEDYFFRY